MDCKRSHSDREECSEIRWWVPQTQRKPPITGSSRCKCQILLIVPLLPVSVPGAGQHHTHTSSSERYTHCRTGSYIYLPVQAGILHKHHILVGVEVHIKVDYRVDEASATVSSSRHTTYYFWPRYVDATHGLGNVSKLSACSFLKKKLLFTNTQICICTVKWLNPNFPLS